MTESTSDPRRMRKLAWACVKWSLFALVLAFVGRQATTLWDKLREQPVTVHFGWLLLATGVSIVAWLPSVWYWRRLMASLGCRVSPLVVARAYYAGHLGKYIPGKAFVFIVRTALVKGQGATPGIAAFTVGYESLAYMASGAVVAAMLSPWILTGERAPHWASSLQSPALRFGLPLVVMGLALGGLAVLSDVFTRLVRFTIPKDAVGGPLPRLSKRECLIGVVPLVAAWWLHGLVLGLTIQAFSDKPFSLADWPVWTAATAVAMVVGFAAFFAPGGLGVREALFIDILEPHLGTTDAILAALLMRAVCFAGEVLGSGALYVAIRPKADDGAVAPGYTVNSQVGGA